MFFFVSVLTVIAIYLLNFSMLTQLMDMILVVDNMDDFVTINIMFLTSVATLCKATTAVIRRDQIIDLTKMLQEEPCKACNEEEVAIQTRYDRLIRLHETLGADSFGCTFHIYLCHPEPSADRVP